MKEGAIFPICLAASLGAHALAIAGAAGLIGSAPEVELGSQVIEVQIASESELSGSSALVAEQSLLTDFEKPELDNLSLQLAPLKLKSMAIRKELKPRARSGDQSIKPQANGNANSGSGDAPGSFSLGASGVGSGAEVLYAPKPAYPWAARLAGFEGKLTLDLLIAASGEVKSASVVESSGRDDCDRSAIETIQSHWKFKPAALNGVPVDCRERVIVRYALR